VVLGREKDVRVAGGVRALGTKRSRRRLEKVGRKGGGGDKELATTRGRIKKQRKRKGRKSGGE